MTVNEMKSYLNQVVEVESSLMGLRASYDILKFHDWYFKAVGTEAGYSVSDLVFKSEIPTYERILNYSTDWYRETRFERDDQIKRVMESQEDWLKFHDAGYYTYDMEERFDEIFPDYSGYSKLSSFDFLDIPRMDSIVKKDLFRKHYRMPAVIKDPMPILDKVEEPKIVDEPKRIGIGRQIFTYALAMMAGVQFGIVFGGWIGAFIGAMVMFLIVFAIIAPQDKKVKEYDAYLERKKAYDEYVLRKKEEWDRYDPYATTKANFMKACDCAFEIAAREYKEFAIKRNSAIEAEIPKLKKQIEESEEVLNKLYALNIIHPKYRSLAIISIFLEYLETGRCTELTGHEGAYNLYESELRQNLIIAKLDVVIQKLDELKATMYRCCMAIENVGKQIQGLEKELKTLNSTAVKQLDVQKDTLRLTALNTTYSAAIAANTEAIKYLTLIQ